MKEWHRTSPHKLLWCGHRGVALLGVMALRRCEPRKYQYSPAYLVFEPGPPALAVCCCRKGGMPALLSHYRPNFSIFAFTGKRLHVRPMTVSAAY